MERKKAVKRSLIRHLTCREMMIYSVLAIVGIWGIIRKITTFTDSDIPYWDASTTIELAGPMAVMPKNHSMLDFMVYRGCHGSAFTILQRDPLS